MYKESKLKINKTYLFIIPLSPLSHKTENRLALRRLCFKTLLNQSYPHWQALALGEYTEDVPLHEKIIHIKIEGSKETKNEAAMEYIRNNGLNPSYLIRLDDDDIFNPTILERIKNADFDVYTDKYHHFWKVDNGTVSKGIKFWFPNTCIIKTSHALTHFGYLPEGAESKNKHPLLFTNEHNNFHRYFNKRHKVRFSCSVHPVYIRAINPDSISFANATSSGQYFKQFGYWRTNRLSDFQFLNQFALPTPYLKVSYYQNPIGRITTNIRDMINYPKYRSVLGLNKKNNEEIRRPPNSAEYKQCTKCVLDTNDDSNILFDNLGVCNYCQKFDEDYGEYMNLSAAEKEAQLHKQVEQIKADGRNKKYDCVCGISGGVDSSYLASRAKELGLRILLVHFDNGWNSELAVKNIEQICKYTESDLFTYVVNWEEFKAIQLAYIKAGVLDWEVPTDHALWAVVLHKARELNIKHVLIGANYQTEGVLPKTMRYDKADLKNIRDIYRKFGKYKRFKTFPSYKFWWHMYLKFVWGLKLDSLLYYMDYNKQASKKYLIDVIGWRDYGGKHYESIFTRFYQGYVLKEKFGFDKRKAHLASLICSGQLTRNEALQQLNSPSIDPALLKEDRSFFIKKMGLMDQEFDAIMKDKPVPHEAFKSYSTFEYPLFKKIISAMISIRKTFKK